jgi:hypothetical protein
MGGEARRTRRRDRGRVGTGAPNGQLMAAMGCLGG